MSSIILLERIEDVKKGFMNEFLSKATYKPKAGALKNQPFITITDYRGIATDFWLRYYKKGDQFAVEEDRKIYPVIAIQDFIPDIDQSIRYVVDHIEEGFYTNESVVKVGTKVFFPIQTTFKFQVSAFTKLHRDFESIQHWFYDNFSIGSLVASSFLFNKISTVDYGDLGIPVSYKAEMQELERDDRTFELDVTFTVKASVYIKKDITVAAPEGIRLILDQMNLDLSSNNVFNGLIQP